MKLYFESDGVKLFHADAMDLLPLFPPHVVDAVVTDPPYGETSLIWDVRVPWPSLCLNLLKAAGSLWCFGSLRMFMETTKDFSGWKFAQDIVWEKQNGSGFQNDRFKRVHECAAHFYPQGRPWGEIFKNPVKTMDAVAKSVRRKTRPPHMGSIAEGSFVSEDGGPRMMRSVLQVRNCHGSAIHPTQKPEGIIEPLLRFSVPAGGVVLDPFAGSGTTLLVARALGMSSIGIEKDEGYCEKIATRLTRGR